MLTWFVQVILTQGLKGPLGFKKEWYVTSEESQNEKIRASLIALIGAQEIDFVGDNEE